MQRQRVFALYRQLLRVASLMPTQHRRRFVEQRARESFEQNRALTSEADVTAALHHGWCMFEQASEQQKHLVSCRDQGLLDNELCPEDKAIRRR